MWWKSIAEEFMKHVINANVATLTFIDNVTHGIYDFPMNINSWYINMCNRLAIQFNTIHLNAALVSDLIVHSYHVLDLQQSDALTK